MATQITQARRYLRASALVLCSLAMSACTEPVLTGPNFPAEGAPYVAEGRDSGAVESLTIDSRLILIGDAGLYLENDPTLKALGNWAGPEHESAVVFLGDNIYDDGLIEEERSEAERILGQQLGATPAPKYVLPGNHDWGMDPAEQNLAAILNQQAFIDDWPEGNTHYGPRDGCIGPEKVLISRVGQSPALVLILLDPTPFLTPRLRDLCANDVSDEKHFADLEAMLAEHENDYVVVASHYPMRTGGPHGGMSYGFLGDMIVGVYAWILGSLGNTYEPEYADWIRRTSEVFRRYPPLVYAAGHDHSLQVIEPENGEVAVHVVSGAGAPERVSTVTNIPGTLFAHAAPGFVVVDIGSRNGEAAVVLRVIENGFSQPVFEMNLVQR